MNFRQVSLHDFTSNKDKKQSSQHVIYFGDTFSSLKCLENHSIHCAITSPPYWNQRDYGFEGQIGNESSIEDYLSRLTRTFGILKNKLVSKGVFFLNIGDKYLSKYGNTPLGMIPFKLANYLLRDGWILQDTIIWYKPNHMPSSVKNRFSNTYEPVFVFTLNIDNYYTTYFSSKDYTNSLKIPLQQSIYKHIATFPENLVISLLQLLNLPKNAIIVDPFAGSGTTSFATKLFNKNHNTSYNSINIEAKHEFVEIIRARCDIPHSFIKNIPFDPDSKSIQITNINSVNILPPLKSIYLPNINYSSSNLIIMTVPSTEMNKIIDTINNEKIFNSLEDHGIFIICLPFLDPIVLEDIAKIQTWIIRNVIIREENNYCFPMLLLVKDIKTIRYRFNLDAIRQEHLNNYKVIKTQSLFKNSMEGRILEVLSVHSNSFPEFVKIMWDDNSTSVEETLNYANTSECITFLCPNCNSILPLYYQNRKIMNCQSCNLELWSDYRTIPNIKLEFNTIPPLKPNQRQMNEQLSKFKFSDSKSNWPGKKIYKGKFTLEDKINRGQSPGARLSVSDQYFFVSRYFNIKHGMFAKFLNLLLKNLKITKQELVRKFPPEYKHTIGHWFRYDMGGSLPKIEDINLLEDILSISFNPAYKQLITKTGIKLQSVFKDKKGKNPGDFLNLPSDKIIDFFIKVTS